MTTKKLIMATKNNWEVDEEKRNPKTVTLTTETITGTKKRNNRGKKNKNIKSDIMNSNNKKNNHKNYHLNKNNNKNKKK